MSGRAPCRVRAAGAADAEEIAALFTASFRTLTFLPMLHSAGARTARPRLERWCFEANAGARRFYERNGFRALRHTDGAGNEEKMPDILYGWTRD